MKYNDLVEKIALKLFHFEGGMSLEDYEAITGKRRMSWKNTYEFQKRPELAEHERDDFRVNASEAVNLLLNLGVLDIEVLNEKK